MFSALHVLLVAAHVLLAVRFSPALDFVPPLALHALLALLLLPHAPSLVFSSRLRTLAVDPGAVVV
mgnify:CR=1 FL=1